MKKRLVSILLTAIMVLGAFGTFAFAENEAPAAGSTDSQGTEEITEPAPLAKGAESGETTTGEVNLSVTATAGPLSAKVSWTADAEGLTYKVTPTVDGVEKPAVSVSGTSYELKGLREGTRVSFKVEAFSGEELVGSAVTDVVAAGAVTLTAEATPGSLSVIASWTADAEGLTYKVTPTVEGTEKEPVDVGSETSYEEKGLTEGTKVSFKVEAFLDGFPVATAVTEEVGAGKIAPPDGVKPFWSYNSVALEWEPVEGAVKYWIYKDGKHVKNAYPDSTAYDVIDHEGKVSSIIWNINDDSYHKFYVRSMSEDGTLSEKSEIKSAKRVTQMYIQVRFRVARDLTSHDGYGKTHYFPKGTKVTAFGFGGGKYKFYYNGYLYWVSYLNTDWAKAITAKTDGYSWNWNKKEAEYFINASGVTSPTQYYFWVSPYVQHVYLFKGSKGRWKLYDDWECNTGAAATPSPTGWDKSIYKKAWRRNGHGPWTAFQSWTSFHDIRFTSEPLGSPISHACVRCPNPKADWIYYYIPYNTRVAVY